MSNGQFNIASLPAAVPLVAQQAAVSVAAAAGGTQHDDGNFAGVLSDLQAKENEGQASDRKGEDVDVTPDVDLLALLQVSPCITTAIAAENEGQGDASVNDTPLRGESADVMSQLSLTAYALSGRMPEGSSTASDQIDMQQNVDAATDITDVKGVSSIVNPAEAKSSQEKHGKHPLQAADAAAMLEVNQPQQTDRVSKVNTLTELPVGGLQNVTTQTVSDQAAAFSAAADTGQAKQIQGEPLQVTTIKAPVILSAEAGTIAAAQEQGVTQVSSRVDQPVKTESSELLQAELTAAALAEKSVESELEIQLSQPRPITARVANTRQQLAPEQQIEAVRPGNDRSAAKEPGQALQMPVAGSVATASEDTSLGNDSNQGESDVAADSRMLVHDTRGQLKTEQQKAFTLAAKDVMGEPARQDAQGQVMQQIKERLVQHDVKPGSQQITLTLSPDSLGELKLNLNLQGQKLSVEIVTENRTVRDAIIQHTDALKESLARQNITMESFDVTTGGKGSGGQGQNQNAWRELAKQQQQQQFWAPPRGYQLAQTVPVSDSAAYQRQQGQTMLDIHY